MVRPDPLLPGLTSIGTPALRAVALDAVHQVKKVDRGGEARPDWLGKLARIKATGEAWKMRDVYGTRIAVIAGYSYPEGLDRSVFLFDIDACGFVEIVGAGVFDDVERAAAAWRGWVGDTAADAVPRRVETADQLECLVHCENAEEMLRGSESRTVLDNWFRARRRMHDLAEALRKRGMPLPAPRSQYDVDIEPAVEAFLAWHADRHGGEPDRETAEALAGEWLEGALPETWPAISPHRIEFQLTLISDWIDDPVTAAAKALLPTWVRWNGERSGLPEEFIERSVAVAAGGARAASDCPGLEVG